MEFVPSPLQVAGGQVGVGLMNSPPVVPPPMVSASDDPGTTMSQNRTNMIRDRCVIIDTSSSLTVLCFMSLFCAHQELGHFV